MEITFEDIFRYYVAWKDKDEDLIKCIEENNPDKFHIFLSGMNISRNFKKSSYKKVFELAKKYKTPTIKDVESFSKELYAAKLLAGKNKNAIVAASKILWLINQDNIIILDSRAKKGLSQLIEKEINSYVDFCTYWEEQYTIFKPLYLKKLQENGIKKFDPLFHKEWFIRRTFDNYLWNKGKNKKY